MMFLPKIAIIVFLCFLFTIKGFSQETSWRELNKQATSLVEQKKYDDAKILYQRALEIVEKTYGPESPVAAYILHNLSYAYHRDSCDHYSSNEERSMEMSAKALTPIERALTILEKTEKKVSSVGGDEWEKYIISFGGHIRSLYRTCISNLANEYKHIGRLAEAEKLYKRVVEIAEEDDWLSKYRLVEVYLRGKKYAEAEPLSRNCLELVEKQYGPHSPKVIKPLEQLITVYLNQRKFPEAGPLLRRYAEIKEKEYDTKGIALFLETIILKTGQRIEGKIVETADNYIKIEFPGVHIPITYFLDDIESIDMAKAKKKGAGESVAFTGAAAIPEKAIRNRLISEVKEAIENGADVNASYRFGSTALMLAAIPSYDDSVDLVKLLIENGADVNATDDSGMTVLRRALPGTRGLFKLLIEHGANVDAQDRRGVTTLMECANRGFIKAVELLIEAGADIDLKDNKGKTALMYSSEKGHFYIAELLVKNGADVSLKDNDGKTALRYAQDGGRRNIVTLFGAGGQKYISSLKDINKDAKAHFDKAKNLLTEGKESQAFSELKKVIEISPKFLLAYHAMGEFALYSSVAPTRKTIELLKIFEKATQINPEDPECYYYLAVLYNVIFRMFDARTAYEKAKDLYNKGAMSTQLYLSDLEGIDFSLKEVNDEIDKMKKEIGRGKISTMSESEKLEAARYCIQKAEGAGMEGLKYYIYAINITPDNPEIALAYYFLAKYVFISSGTFDIHDYYYQKAIELNPDMISNYERSAFESFKESEEQKRQHGFGLSDAEIKETQKIEFPMSLPPQERYTQEEIERKRKEWEEAATQQYYEEIERIIKKE